MSEDIYKEDDVQPEGNYLFWALLGTCVVIAIGSTALLSKMTQRPDLAAADPLLMTVLQWARGIAAAGLGVMGGLLAVQMFGKTKD